MFNRFRDGLVYPKMLLQYRKDAMWKVILYIIFFAILFSTASIIDVIKYDGVADSYKEYVRQEATSVTEDCAINNAVLVCDSEYMIEIYEETIFTFYLDSYDELDFDRYDSSGYTVIIHNDSVHFNYNRFNMYSYLISDLDSSIHNLDFNDQTDDPTTFYNLLFIGVDEILVRNKLIWGASIFVFEIPEK